MASVPEITTERLRLRAFRDADALHVQRLAGDRRIADTTSHVPHPYPDGIAEAWIATHEASWELGRGLALAVASRATDELLGAIGLTIKPEQKSAELGYWIGVPYWGQGYCSEAARGLIDFAFTAMGLERVHAHHFARNPASGRVMEKAGMTYEGTRAGVIMKWGRPEDAKFYGIARTDWERHRAAR